MPAITRIYQVSNGDKVHLVRASTTAQAIASVASKTFEVRVASQDDLIAAIKAGVEVESK